MGRAVFLIGLALIAACGRDSTQELSGAELFVEVGCPACHGDFDTDVAPTLEGVWGTPVLLDDGRTVVVDEAYVRKSLTEPSADIVDGYEARMPIFPLVDAEVDKLVDYVMSRG